MTRRSFSSRRVTFKYFPDFFSNWEDLNYLATCLETVRNKLWRKLVGMDEDEAFEIERYLTYLYKMETTNHYEEMQ